MLNTHNTSIISIHPEAPSKPTYGEPCNGCGVCCLDELCPPAILRYHRKKGPCPQLIWIPYHRHYRCQWLLTTRHSWLRWWLHRAIFAGKGCDSTAVIVSQPQ